jgi:hypothetical protein
MLYLCTNVPPKSKFRAKLTYLKDLQPHLLWKKTEKKSKNFYLSLQSGCPAEDGRVDAQPVPCCHTPRTVPPGGGAEAAAPQPGRAGGGGRGWRGGGGRGRRRGPSWPAAGRWPCQWPAGEIANEDAPRCRLEHSGKSKNNIKKSLEEN